MKKLFSLVAMALMTMGANAQNVVQWAVSEAPTSGTAFNVSDNGKDVLQIAFGTSDNWLLDDGEGKNTYSIDITYKEKKYSFDHAATTKSTNGNGGADLAADGSSAYNYMAIVPKYNGTLIIGVQNQGNKKKEGDSAKPTYLYEDGVAKSGTLIGKDGKTNIAYDGQSDLAEINGLAAYSGGIQIEVKAGSVYTISVTGSKGRWNGVIFDYELPTTVEIPATAIVSETGYASFCSDQALDFTDVEDLEAYVISEVTESSATLTQVKKVPAGTGLILKGTAGEAYTVDILDGDADTFTNKLEAATTATTVDANSVYVVNEGALHPFSGTEIPAGKAYLPMTSGARVLPLVFGEATGINAVQVNEGDNAIYDLSGRRVEKPSKGIFVVNGQKIVVK